MSIDWITVAAQIANFLVLIWLLKRFLYRPILDGIDAREQEIAERMSEATRIRESAQTAEADYRAQIASLRQGREGLMDETRRAAEAERDAMLAEARAQIARERQERENQRAQETLRYSRELHNSGAHALLSLTRKALADLSDETLEQRIVSQAAARSAELSEQLKTAAAGQTDARIVTQHCLPHELQEQLTAEFSRTLPDCDITFHVDPEQSPGLTLRLGGAQLGWTVDSYMNGLEELLRDGVSVRTRGNIDAA
jgi:F-type H+-transporting ATPase subunit b